MDPPNSSSSCLPLRRKHPEPSLPPDQPPQASHRRIPIARNNIPSPSSSLPLEQPPQASRHRIPIARTTPPSLSPSLPLDPLQSPQVPRRRIPAAPTTSPFPSPSLPLDPLQSLQVPRRRIPVAPTTSPFPSPSLPPEQIHNISVSGTTASPMDKNKNGDVNNEEEDYETKEDDYLTEEDDYYIEEDSCYSEDDDYFSGGDDDEKSRIILRGPGCSGDESFDKCCIFGNEVELKDKNKNGDVNNEEEDYETKEDDYLTEEDDYYIEEDSYYSEDDDYFSGGDDDEKSRIILRGMDEIGCFFCRQPLENCGRRSNRRAVSFEVLMMQGFEDGVVVPCKFREQVSKFARSENWMVAQCPMRVYDMYLGKDDNTTTICGPYWRSLVRLYDIQLGDVVSFTYVEEQNKFQLNVYQIVNNEKEEKLYVGEQVVYDVTPRIRVQLHKAIFTNIRAISEEHMASITFGLTKVVMLSPTQELDDNEFYESAKELQFFVHIYNEENVHFDALYLNPKPFNHVGSPVNGFAHLWKRDLEEPVVAWYHIEGDDHIAITMGWDHFREQSHIIEGTLLLMIAQSRVEAIVEIINPMKYRLPTEDDSDDEIGDEDAEVLEYEEEADDAFFEVNVADPVGNKKKPFHLMHGPMYVPKKIRGILYKTVFSYMHTVGEVYMSEIIWEMTKDANQLGNDEDTIDELQYIVHRVDAVDMAFKRLPTGKEISDMAMEIQTAYGKLQKQKRIARKKRQRVEGEEDVENEEEVHTIETTFKKRSIFFQLEYWKFLLVRHNLDSMHIEKNVFDNIVNTLLDVDKRSKDNAKARLDMKRMKIRKHLHIDETQEKPELPDALYYMDSSKKKLFRGLVKNVKFPDNHASSMFNKVRLEENKFVGLKTHDCHILFEYILPLAVMKTLPEDVAMPLVKLAKCFKVITSKIINSKEIEMVEEQMPEILCQLENIFPPTFFDIMEHLVIHLPAKLEMGSKPFIFASQAKQIYYVKDDVDDEWYSVVCPSIRDYFDMEPRIDRTNNLDTQDFKKKMIEVGQAAATESNGGDIFERFMHIAKASGFYTGISGNEQIIENETLEEDEEDDDSEDDSDEEDDEEEEEEEGAEDEKRVNGGEDFDSDATNDGDEYEDGSIKINNIPGKILQLSIFCSVM
ncbi:hypothetical protein ACQ4PT_002004 [Festuca glaucescens]